MTIQNKLFNKNILKKFFVSPLVSQFGFKGTNWPLYLLSLRLGLKPALGSIPCCDTELFKWNCIENPLQSMTAWSLEPMDMCFLLWDALPALYCSCCLFCVSLPSALSSVTEKHVLLGWHQVTDFAIEAFSISLPCETLGLLSVMVDGS